MIPATDAWRTTWDSGRELQLRLQVLCQSRIIGLRRFSHVRVGGALGFYSDRDFPMIYGRIVWKGENTRVVVYLRNANVDV
jgi:hypothetical protein